MANQRAPASILDAVLPAADLAVLNVTVRDLSVQTATPEGILQWLARHGLIHNQLQCANCDIPMSLQSHTGRQFIDSFCWACRVCRRQRAVTIDSFFAGSQLKLPQLLDCIYWWSREIKLAGACVESGVGHTSMVQWRNFIRDISCQYLLDHPVIMGGSRHTVEIDESKFMHRKYHRGPLS